MADLYQDVPTRDQIQLRAYKLYLRRGGEDGRDVEDWLGLPPRPNYATSILRLPESLRLAAEAKNVGRFQRFEKPLIACSPTRLFSELRSARERNNFRDYRIRSKSFTAGSSS